MRRPTICLVLLLAAAPLYAQERGAQERGAPKPVRPENYGLTPDEVGRHTAALPRHIETSARGAQAKRDALEQRLEKRVRQATRSICAGCTPDRAARGHARRGRAREAAEPVIATDPAEAPPLD